MRGVGTVEASLHEPPSGTRLEADCATGVGRVEESGWLSEARNREAEREEAQRRARE